MNSLKAYSFLVILILFFTKVFGQQCAYTSHAAIILDIRSAETNEKIRNLTIALCDQDGSAFTDYNFNCKNHELLGQLDSFTFWDNEKLPKQKSRTCTDKFYRQKFEGVGDNYVCIVPTYTGDNDYLRQKRNLMNAEYEESDLNTINNNIYLYLKIKGKNIKEQILKIPGNILYDICKCHLYSTNSRCEIEPIRISINKEKVISVTDDRFGIIQVNKSISTYTKFSFDGEYKTALEQVLLVDELTGKTVQSIPSRKEVFYNKIFNNKHKIKYLNAERYSVNVPHPRIMVPAKLIKENWSSKAIKGKDYKSYIIYKFDEVTNRYIIDSIFSQPDFIAIEYDNINPSFNAIYGMDVQETDKAFIYKYYKLIDGKWQNPEEETVVKVVDTPKVKIVAKGVPNCAFYEKQKTKPVQYFDVNKESITLMDTFYMYNYGTATAKLKKTYGEFFTVQNEIKPNEKIPVYYKRTFYKNKQNATDLLIPYMENVIIEFDSDKSINAVIQFSMINKAASVKNNDGGGKIFYLPTSQNEFMEVRLDANLNLIAQGKRLFRDSSQIGIWSFTEIATGDKTQKQFKKTLQLYINPEYYINSCQIFLLDKEGNKTTYNHNSGRNLQLYISENITRIEVYKDSAVGSYDVDFKSLQQIDYALIYLIKPSDNYYYNGRLKVPFNFIETQYHIRWNISKLETDKIRLQQLKDNFPKLEIIFANRNYMTDIIDFRNLNSKEREAILNYLDNNKNINFVAQLWQTTRSSYCDNRIYVPIEYSKLSKEQMSKIEALGFKFDQLYYGPSEVKSIFKFNSKIVDNNFIQQYNKLVALLDYPKCTLNTYFQMVEEAMFKD